jgi:hypothetical protein
VAEAVYFAIVRRLGRDEPQLFYDIVPPVLAAKGSPLVYCTRIDTLPQGEQLLQAPLWRLLAVYEAMKADRVLPPEDRGGRPQAAAGATRIGTGERYHYLSGWDRDAPAYPPLDDPAWRAGVGHKKTRPERLLGGPVALGEVVGEDPYLKDRSWAVEPPQGH